MQIPIDLLRKTEDQVSGTDQQVAAIKNKIQTEDGPTLDGPVRAAQRKQMIAETAPDPVDAYERYIGKNDLLPINYLDIGNIRSRSVGRLRYTDLSSNSLAMATGFLISPDLILTNHHVFQGKDLFKDAFIDFDYAYDASGQELTKIVFQINPEKFFYTFKDLDFTLVGIEPKDQTGTHLNTGTGLFDIESEHGKAGIGDSATIIQYPDGNYQQVGLRENQILDLSDPNSLIYQTDTSPGTSGSPVFNDQWQVIALHSAGVAKKDAKGNYIDENGPAHSRGRWQGRQYAGRLGKQQRYPVSALMKQITGDASIKNDPKIQFLSSPAYSDAKKMVNISSPQPDEAITIPDIHIPANNTNDSAMPPINIPNNTGTINIYTNGKGYPVIKMQQGAVQPDADAEESKKITTDQDFADCKGFQANGFLSFETPLPSLSKQLARRPIPLTDNPKSNVLEYLITATIQHAIRKMPLISAINVEGNVADRKDSSKRVDRWLQDNRIDPDTQLSDAYYTKSGFDKGHMSRREDADYGSKSS